MTDDDDHVSRLPGTGQPEVPRDWTARVDDVAIWLCDHGWGGAGQLLWQACGLWPRKHDKLGRARLVAYGAVLERRYG